MNEKNIINGSFENSYDGVSPDGWYTNGLPHTKNNAAFSIDNSVYHSGGHSILISLNKKLPEESFIYNWVRRIDDLKPSKVYQVLGWIKTEGINNSPYLKLECLSKKTDNLLASLSTKSRDPVTGNTNWKRVDLMIKIPSGTDKVLLIAGVESKDNEGGKVWFDDISITPL